MFNFFHDLGHALEWRAEGETLCGAASGTDAVRVRATPGGALLKDLPGALLPEQTRAVAASCLPPVRPLLELPEEEHVWTVEDSFLLGPDLLVAPVTDAGAREREVYLLLGASWTEAGTGEVPQGCSTIRVEAPLESIPPFLRDGAELLVRAGES
ncbi:hypothetical protein [Streptomyces sp. HUAS ZL42]|uniref:hypothetical protein n=1 Tax=Streptomyces sp. HUAS ZL42 TaxID=3231715 RepID=UPI00345E5ACD